MSSEMGICDIYDKIGDREHCELTGIPSRHGSKAL